MIMRKVVLFLVLFISGFVNGFLDSIIMICNGACSIIDWIYGNFIITTLIFISFFLITYLLFKRLI